MALWFVVLFLDSRNICVIQSALFLWNCLRLHINIFIKSLEKAEDGIRRKMDIISASSGALIYTISWILYCNDTCFLMGIPILILIFFSFLLSNLLSVHWNTYWVYMHMLFHASVSISEMLVIHCKSKV